jgi:hypothetical protein
VEGTIVATKKSSYADVVGEDDWEKTVRGMMKDQHRAMFIELRDGVHDDGAGKLFEYEGDEGLPSTPSVLPEGMLEAPTIDIDDEKGVRVIRPAVMEARRAATSLGGLENLAETSRGRSIFDTPNDDGEFGENLITDKSLDEVILSYLTDELDES